MSISKLQINIFKFSGNSEITSWDFEMNIFSIFAENNQLIHLVLENNNISSLGKTFYSY